MSRIPIKKLASNYKALKSYSNQELLEFLEENEATDMNVLSGICSEILRRKIKEDENFLKTRK